MKPFYRITLPVLFCLCGLFSFAQTDHINSLISSVNGLRARLPIEKLYLRLDKPAYVQGDTIWFKACLLDADYLVPSQRSGLLYIELDDSDNKSVKRMMVPLVSGLSWGNISLDESVPGGSYTLRAYTNWMRNFGTSYIFEKSIDIAPAGEQARLVAAGFKQSKREGKDNIRAGILISNINEQPVRLRDMQLKVMDGKRALFKSAATTGVDGKLDINFDLPENTGTKNLSIIAQDVTRDRGSTMAPLIIPVTLNRPENIDLQFMPEGGALVAGIPVKIGFKAIGEDGNGTDVSGKIFDSKQQEVTAFKSGHRGMGSFDLAPQAGERYTAKLILPGGSSKSYLLPPVNSSGTGLSISDHGAGDSLKVTVAVSPNLLAPGAAYYLIGQSRGVVCYGAELIPKSISSVLLVPKALFPTGIARFTLLNATNLPLNERIRFIDHQDNLRVSVVANKNNYMPHDSIALKIQVTDKTGNPVRGSFAMAVTDDNQVRGDSAGSNIVNDLLLTSDLKGAIEQPGYYFENSGAERVRELDNLMLTQGWTSYEWKQVTGPEIKPVFATEKEFTVQGKVTNFANRPAADAQLILLSKKPAMLMQATTKQDGRFLFKGFEPADTAVFIIQARNKHGKSFNVGVAVDEVTPPVFAAGSERTSPWYVNSDTLLLHSLNNRVAKQQAQVKLTGQHLLKEVTIKGKKVIKDSKNLNGPGGADITLDEEDMEKAQKLSLYVLLQQKFKNFHKEMLLERHGVPVPSDVVVAAYFLFGHRVHFIIDGVFIDHFDILPDVYMDYLTAEDIKGIEIMRTAKYAAAYDPNFSEAGRERMIPIYLEITTRSGNGAFAKTTPGIYVYKPLAFSLPKQFYRPKYNQKNKETSLPDLRSTIHWEPNIVTDTAGKATVSFYSADKPAGYTIILEGTDLTGRFGFTRRKLLVK